MKQEKQNQFNNRRKKKSSKAYRQEQRQIQPVLYQRFLKFLTKSRESKLFNGLLNYYGKNFSIEYKPKFNFHQRWEQQKMEHTLDEYLFDFNPAYSLLSLIILIINVFAVWALSTQRYFGTKLITNYFSLYYILIALKMVEILSKFIIKSKRDQWNRVTIKDFIKINWRQLFCLFFFTYSQIIGDVSNAIEHMVQLCVYYLLWNSASNIYQNFKLRSFALRYENQLKVFDLLVNLFIQAHIFAIMMVLASKINPETSWMMSLGISQAPVFTRYLYAYYFSCTTMLTIGYGDITPKNPGQVIVVIIIQIIGVVSFGYLLNQMGHTLSKIRQEKEALQKDLQTIGKMANYYNLEKNLQNRAKKYIITNTKIMDELRPDDENKLLMKLNDQLRTQITNQNYLSILKTSIFFLCHWSKSFQSEIAKSLQKRLFSPNQRLADTVCERIYIIKTGKLSIYMNRFNNHNKKLLRKIEIQPGSTVTNNIYGYTSVFSNRPVHLQAIAKELTTAYSISNANFMRCVALDYRDSQYYHEIKSRIDQSSFCEEWQAPAIKNIRQHYIPSKIFLIKRHRIKQTKQLNERKFQRRRPKNKYNLFNNLIVSNAENFNPYNTYHTLGEKTLQFKLAMPKKAQQDKIPMSVSDQFFESSEVQNDSSSSNENIEQNTLNQRERSIELAKVYFKTRMSTGLEQSANKQIIAYIFEKKRDYKNFFPKNNFNHILLRFEKENCFEKGINSLQR